jgi:hypothetical protein
MDLPRYVQVMAEFMGPVLKGQGLPINIPPLKAPKGKTYFGVAVILQPTRGSLEIWLPGTTVHEISKMVQQAMAGGAGTE